MGYADPQRQRDYCKEHYRRNKAKYYANNRRSRERSRAIVNTAKNVPCADCRKRFPPICMDFDHRDPMEKVALVSVLATQRNVKGLIAEIAKCEVVCANCHRIRTERQSLNGPIRRRIPIRKRA